MRQGPVGRIARRTMPKPPQAQCLFPVGGRLKEAEQISRGPAIDDLERICLGGSSALLFDERRVGKSSVAGAVSPIPLAAAIDAVLGEPFVPTLRR